MVISGMSNLFESVKKAMENYIDGHHLLPKADLNLLINHLAVEYRRFVHPPGSGYIHERYKYAAMPFNGMMDIANMPRVGFQNFILVMETPADFCGGWNVLIPALKRFIYPSSTYIYCKSWTLLSLHGQPICVCIADLLHVSKLYRSQCKL